jgi:hypothetical protein
MKFRVVHLPTPNHGRSAFRIVETTGREVDWGNRYLDYECLRRVADLTLRSYFMRPDRNPAISPLSRKHRSPLPALAWKE